ncbi:MAG: Gfo/Idh/MocA family oxidoreductase [Clostridia bacterium]|nr:Gfo/Idh/MocA family oxidoreductase [Clostridia bacterium]
MKKLNVAIIGQGRSGYAIHGKHFLNDTERFQVKYVVDALKERREKAEKVFGCQTFECYEALFDKKDDIDVVVNASFSMDHYPITLALLKKGFNVVSEKPFAYSPEQAEEMIQASEESGAMLAPFQQSRLAPYFLKVREVIDSGKLGRIVAVNIAFSGFARRWDWQTIQDNVAGSLYNTGPHPVDQALTLLGGDEIPEIFCKMDRATTFGDAEDYIKLIMTLPGRPLVDLEISSSNAYPWGTYNVQGTNGGLWGTLSEMKWRWFDEKQAPEQKLIRTPLSTPEGEPAYCSEKLPWQEDEWKAGEGENAFVGAVEAFYTNIYNHILSGEPLKVQPKEVARQIAVIRKCHELNPLDKFC